MIYIVSEENRRRFHHLLTEMHRQRKQVFIDKLKWRLEESAGLEIDAYDSHEAIYLIEAGTPTSDVSVSARLLPTVRQHLLSQQFADLCEEELPAGPGVWEATRFCPAPDTPAGPPRRDMLGRMIAGIMETALLFGVEQVTYVADAALAPMAQKVGWDVPRARRAARQGPQSHSGLRRQHRWRRPKARARSLRHHRAVDAVRTRRPRARAA